MPKAADTVEKSALKPEKVTSKEPATPKESSKMQETTQTAQTKETVQTSKTQETKTPETTDTKSKTEKVEAQSKINSRDTASKPDTKPVEKIQETSPSQVSKDPTSPRKDSLLAASEPSSRKSSLSLKVNIPYKLIFFMYY